MAGLQLQPALEGNVVHSWAVANCMHACMQQIMCTKVASNITGGLCPYVLAFALCACICRACRPPTRLCIGSPQPPQLAPPIFHSYFLFIDSMCFIPPTAVCISFPKVRYYYNTTLQECREYLIFLGCNENNFPTLEACQCECKSTCSEDTTSPPPSQENLTTTESTTTGVSTKTQVTPRTIQHSSTRTETASAMHHSSTEMANIPKTTVKTTRQLHASPRPTEPSAKSGAPTQESPALNSYGYVVVAIGVVVIVLMVGTVVLTAVVMWRIVKQRTKIMLVIIVSNLTLPKMVFFFFFFFLGKRRSLFH